MKATYDSAAETVRLEFSGDLDSSFANMPIIIGMYADSGNTYFFPMATSYLSSGGTARTVKLQGTKYGDSSKQKYITISDHFFDTGYIYNGAGAYDPEWDHQQFYLLFGKKKRHRGQKMGHLQHTRGFHNHFLDRKPVA